MLPATSQKAARKQPMAEDPLDPYELVRRLSIIQAEETFGELARRRTDWETQLIESRGVRQTQIRNRIQTASLGTSHKQRRRSASVSLAPDQLPPAAHTDLPESARKHSLSSSARPHSRRPSLMRGDPGDLATINENAVVEPTMEIVFLEGTERERRQMSALAKVNEDCASETTSTAWKPRRRSSSIPRPESRQQYQSQSDSQSIPSRRSSSLQAQKEHRRQGWSQSDEGVRPTSRKSSLLDKIERKPSQADASAEDAFSSKASTLRNSWRSSMSDSILSRRPSMPKKVGDQWMVSPPSSDAQPGVKNIHANEIDSVVYSAGAKTRSGLFSKFRR